MVDYVAQRDNLTPQEARDKVAATLRWVAAARAEAAAREGEPAPELTEARRSHLVRAARARLWLTEEFEPKHRAQDIPNDHPALVAARSDPRYIHPLLHRVCQIVVLPKVADAEEAKQLAIDPQWRSRARALVEPMYERMKRVMRPGDLQACELMREVFLLHDAERGDVRLKIEDGAFVLDACAEENDDGTCKTRQWVPEWREPLSTMDGAGFAPILETRFGLHIVFVLEVLPPRLADDPGADAFVREQVVARWRSEQLSETLTRLREKRAVRVAAGAGAP